MGTSFFRSERSGSSSTTCRGGERDDPRAYVAAFVAEQKQAAKTRAAAPAASPTVAADMDKRILGLLDDERHEWPSDRVLNTQDLQHALRLLCLELARVVSSDDRAELLAMVRWHGGDQTGSGMRANPPEWELQIDVAVTAETRPNATRAITRVADELEHGRAGASATGQAMRWWRLAEFAGSDRARTRLRYLRIRGGDKEAALAARDRCISFLRGSRLHSQKELADITKTTLLATEAALILDDGELAALALQHLSQQDFMTTDEDKLSKLRALAASYYDSPAARTSQDAEDGVRVILSHVAPVDARDKESFNRLGPLLTPLPLKAWPTDLAWADALDREFPWMHALTGRLRQQAVMRTNMGSSVFKIHPILIVGAAGIGKTSYLRRLGELTGIPSMMYSLAGSADNAALKGTARGWGTARPGIVLEFMASSACPNPVVLLDEIDKASSETRNGNVWNTLLNLLEPSSARRLQDEYVLGDVDYGHVNWLATANDLSQMPSTLRSRLSVVEVEGPRAEHFDIVYRNVLREVAAEFGVAIEMLPRLDDAVVDAMRDGFARASNMRVLSRVVRAALASASTWRPEMLN